MRLQEASKEHKIKVYITSKVWHTFKVCHTFFYKGVWVKIIAIFFNQAGISF